MEKRYLSTHNCYFNVCVWLHLLREMKPGKNHLLMSYAHALQPSLTTNSMTWLAKKFLTVWGFASLENITLSAIGAITPCKGELVSRLQSRLCLPENNWPTLLNVMLQNWAANGAAKSGSGTSRHVYSVFTFDCDARSRKWQLFCLIRM